MTVLKEQWVIYALMSAVFAALTSVFAKVGIDGINSNLATAIRTCIVLILSWTIVIGTKELNGIRAITAKGWLFLILSGLATGASWICYYKALQMGTVSKVAPIDKFSVVLTIIFAFIILGEKPDLKTIVGGLFISVGTFILVL